MRHVEINTASTWDSLTAEVDDLGGGRLPVVIRDASQFGRIYNLGDIIKTTVNGVPVVMIQSGDRVGDIIT